MEAAKKSKVFGIVMRIVFFLVLFCAFLGLYYSPFSYFNDSYGLLKGPKEQIIVQNLMGVWDFVYIKSINGLYLFLGEKPGVIIGYHIFLRMINSLLLFFSLEKAKKPILSGVLTLVYGIYPFAIHELYNYDGILIAELFCLLLLFFISFIANGIIAGRRQELSERAEMVKGTLPEAQKSEEGSSLELEKSLQVEKMGEQMKQNETITGNMEKGEVVKERDGIPNFLELTDEEIRRNAMIAAGLLSGQEEEKNESDKNGAPKKKLKKKQGMRPKQPGKQSDAGIEQSEKQSNTKKEQANMAHTQFIENPLPVPKRHVKKEMDYEYQVPEEQMHFDIEEPDKNYFDVV